MLSIRDCVTRLISLISHVKKGATLTLRNLLAESDERHRTYDSPNLRHIFISVCEPSADPFSQALLNVAGETMSQILVAE